MNDLELASVAERVLRPVDEWVHKCHEASYALMRSGEFGRCRVARGSCTGVGAQHSWLVIGDDCYAPAARILDPTLWSYDPAVRGIWTGSARAGKHRPFGSGSIWGYGRPRSPSGPVIQLDPPLSTDAKDFLAMLGPLDRQGWSVLAHAPVGGWPSAEILAAIDDTPQLTALVPIDVLGMLTDRNPGGLYLPTA